MLLEAQFVGLIQVMVYAGAIVVLFLFVIMLLNLRGSGAAGAESQPIAKAVGALVARGRDALARAHARPRAARPGRDVDEGFGTTRAIGEALYTDYVLSVAGRRRAAARRDRRRGRAGQEEDRLMGDVLGRSTSRSSPR